MKARWTLGTERVDARGGGEAPNVGHRGPEPPSWISGRGITPRLPWSMERGLRPRHLVGAGGPPTLPREDFVVGTDVTNVDLSPLAARLVPLLPEEHPVQTWQTRLSVNEWRVFHLTTRRIVVFRRSMRGALSRSEHWELLAARPLEEIPEPTMGEERGPRGRKRAVLNVAGFSTSIHDFSWTKDMTADGNAKLVAVQDSIANLRLQCIERASTQPAGGPPRTTSGHAPQIVTREIIKVPCPYCRSLTPIAEDKCNSCGAPLRIS